MPSNTCIEVISLLEDSPQRFKKRKRNLKEEKSALHDIGTNHMDETERTGSKFSSISSSSFKEARKFSMANSSSGSNFESDTYGKLDTDLSSMLGKMKAQKMRQGIRERIEAKYGTGRSREKMEELSCEQCRCALEQCYENLDDEVAKLTNQLQNSFIPEKELDQKRIQLIEEQHRIYEAFAIDARLKELARYWKKFVNIVEESFGDLKIMSFETSTRMARQRMKTMNNEIESLKFIIDQLKQDLKRRDTEEKSLGNRLVEIRSKQNEIGKKAAKVSISDGAEEEECRICVDNPKNTALSCGHKMCRNCLRSLHLRNISTCPFCQAEIEFTIFLKDVI